MENALESLEYLYKSQRGKAYIRPVVEKNEKVEEFGYFCSPRRPEVHRKRGFLQSQKYFLYSAYYDDRPNSLFIDNDVIQVIVMHFRSISGVVYCNIFSGNTVSTVKGYVREIWQRSWDPRFDFYGTFLITCPVTRSMKSRDDYIINLTQKHCETADTGLDVETYKENVEKKKNGVAICVKGMDFQEDISHHLVEWIEGHLLLGVDKITTYINSIHPNTQKVLNNYPQITQISLDIPSDDFPNVPHVRSEYIQRNRQQKRRHELVPYNDCFYRHLKSHDFILILDTDEMIVPLKHENLQEMLKEVQEMGPEKKISSLSVNNVFKFTDKDRTGWLDVRNRTRKSSGKGQYGKSFTSTSNVATVFNHFALHRLSSEVSKTIHLPEDMVIKLHLKQDCPIEIRKDCDDLKRDTVIDTSLDRFRRDLESRVAKTRELLGFV